MKNVHYNLQDFDTAINLALKYHPDYNGLPRFMLERHLWNMIDKFKTDENVTLVHIAGITIESVSRTPVDIYGNTDVLYLAFSFDVSFLTSLATTITSPNSSDSMLPHGMIEDEI